MHQGRHRPVVAAVRRWTDSRYARSVTAVILALGAVVQVRVSSSATVHDPFFTVVLMLLAVSTTVPVALLRPVAAAVAVTVANLLSVAPFQSLTAAGIIAQLILMYRLARSGPQLFAATLTLPLLVVAVVEPGIGVVLLTVLGPGSAVLGAAIRTTTERRAVHAARADVLDSLLEHTARRERARIARELHDVVAHHVSMIAVQAETARLTTPGMPAAGAQRLLAIGDTARSALTEMRRLLGVLREDVDSDTAERLPQPGLRQLNELLDEARSASGTATRLILRGSPDQLDPGVELAAYRIVQEALTNSRRHAPGAAVDVELYYTDLALRVRIRDNGPGPGGAPDARPGHGLLGMRERATAVGGQLRTGPAVGGGFLVETVFPVGRDPR